MGSWTSFLLIPQEEHSKKSDLLSTDVASYLSGPTSLNKCQKKLSTTFSFQRTERMHQNFRMGMFKWVERGGRKGENDQIEKWHQIGRKIIATC